MTEPDRQSEEREAMIGIARKILDQSLAGNVEWSELSSARDTFFTGVAGTGVSIGSVDGDGRHPFEMRLLNPSGSTIQRLDTGELVDEPSRGETGAAVLADLYEVARKQGRQFNKVVAEMSEELDRRAKKDDIPF